MEHTLLWFLSSLFSINLGFAFCEIVPLSLRADRFYGDYSRRIEDWKEKKSRD